MGAEGGFWATAAEAIRYSSTLRFSSRVIPARFPILSISPGQALGDWEAGRGSPWQRSQRSMKSARPWSSDQGVAWGQVARASVTTAGVTAGGPTRQDESASPTASTGAKRLSHGAKMLARAL